MAVVLFGWGPVAHGAVGGAELETDPAELQRVLAVLGLLEWTGEPASAERAQAALRELQRRHGLPETGEVDARTLAVLGGPSDELARLPRVLYRIQQGDTLSSLAARFDTSIAVLARLNPALTSSLLTAGERLVVPLAVPAPPGFRLERFEVCDARFVGSYSAVGSVEKVEALLQAYVEVLSRAGFEVSSPSDAPLTGITFRRGEALAGTFSFSSQTPDGRILVDLAVLADFDGALASVSGPVGC